MVELPSDIRQAVARSRAGDEPSAEDQARVASALALRLGMPDADWTSSPPSAAKGAVAHSSWAAKLLAGAGVVGLATTLLVALPALRKAGEGTRAAPLTAASTSRAAEMPAPEVVGPPTDTVNRAGVDREAEASEPRRGTTRSSRQARDTRSVVHGSPSQSAISSRAAATREPHSRAARNAADDLPPPSPARMSQATAANEGAQLARAGTPRASAIEAPPPSAANTIQPARTDTLRSNPAAVSQPSAANTVQPARANTPRSNAVAIQPPSAADNSNHASLARELALVRGASHALDRDEPQAALQLLNQHAREFGDGALTGEREALRLSALCRLGRDAEARALRAKLAAELAHSPLRARIEHDCAHD